MRPIRWFLPTILLLVLPLAMAASADEGPHWEATIEAAKRQAAQSNRLVLVHFVMNDCIYCKKLEANVFAKPGVGAAIESRFVAVKLNADDFPGTARLYGIDRFPSDVILTPTGRVLYKLGCPQEPGKYLAQLNQAAAAANGSAIAQAPTPGQYGGAQGPAVRGNANDNPYRSATASAAPSPAPIAPNSPANPTVDPAGLSVYSSSNYANYLHRDPAASAVSANGASAVAVPAATGPAIPASAAAFARSTPNIVAPNNAAPASNIQPNLAATSPRNPTPGPAIVAAQPAVPPNTPPMGLDGFCAVTLVERSRTAPEDPRCWTHGDPRWGAVHRGVTYLFIGPEEQKRFLQEPDRFAPALSGNDSVLAFDRGQLVRGHREFGIFFENRIYLFANAETLERFQQNPRRYADEVRQAENPQHLSVR